MERIGPCGSMPSDDSKWKGTDDVRNTTQA